MKRRINGNLIMAVNDRVHIYSSPNIKDWTLKVSSEWESALTEVFGNVLICFRLKIEGAETTKWVMLVSINPGGPNKGSATQYFTGEFDGHKFVPDELIEKWVDWGRDNYAGVTWSNIPGRDGRRIFIGWMSNWEYATVVPTTVWRSATTIPRELSLKEEDGHYFLTSKPITELGKLRIATDTNSVNHLSFNGEKEISTGSLSIMQSEMLFGFNFSGNNVDSLGVILENSLNERFIIGYSVLKKQFYIDRRNSGSSDFSKEFAGISTAPYKAGTVLKMHLLIDASSVELFVDDGRLVMTTLVFPTEKFTRLKLFSKGGTALLNKAVFYGLEKIWH